MRWYPKTLKCQIYDDGQLIDLNSCSDSVLYNLTDVILVHWKTPLHSAIWFDIEVYEKHYWFKPTKNTVEVVAYTRDADTLTGKSQVNISQLHIDKMVGRKFKILPDTTLIRKWSSNVEVAFVV